jgi:hypothetical protein
MDVRQSEDLLGFRGRQHGLGQSKTEPRHFQLGCRIVQDVMTPRHPLKPRAQRSDALLLAGEGERLTVFLPVMKDVR